MKKEVLKEMKEKNQKEQKKDNDKNFEEKAKETIDKIMDTEDNTKDYDKKDIESNKGLAMISYLGPLCLVPYLVNKDSKFVKYHAKQGLNLFVIELIVSIVSYFIYSVVQILKMCTNLTGTIKINSRVVSEVYGDFDGTTKQIALQVPSGSSTHTAFNGDDILPGNVTLTTY